jgi:hypothetical protein
VALAHGRGIFSAMISVQESAPNPGTYAHVSVVLSMVLGLSVTQSLKGVAQLYRTRARVRSYWLYWAWMILQLFFILLLWWTYWSYRTITDWNFVRFVVYLSPVVTFFYLTAIAFPNPTEEAVNLREFYYSNRRGYFSTFAIYIALAGVTAVVVRGLPVLDASNLFRLTTIVLLVLAMRSASERLHTFVFAVSAILMIVFIALYQFRLA